MGSFRDRIYEEDPADREVRNIYDAIDERMEDWKEIDSLIEEAAVDPEFWQEDIAAILEDVGISSEIEVPMFPKEQLERIEKFYGPKSGDYNDDGMYEEIDPIPTYYAGEESREKELYKLGYAIGLTDNIGKYYKLLPLIEFSRGYWLSKFENAINEDSDEKILQVSREIKIVDPKKAEKELTKIVNKCFTDAVDIDKSTLDDQNKYLR